MYRVMRRRPMKSRWGKKAKLGKPQVLAEFEQYDDASKFVETTPGSWIVYPKSEITKLNETRNVA